VYLTEAWLEGTIGVDRVAALCPTADALGSAIDMAEAEVETALLNGGYPGAVPSTVYTSLPAAGVAPTSVQCPKAITLLAFGAWLELVHGINGIELPAQFAAYVQKLDLVRNGKIELPGVAKGGVDKDITRAVGGVSFTDSSTTSEDGKPAIFTRASMRDGGW
jgi:hypothetical protein